ncbi:unnamed protein product [Oncorhynchus mykiss]|uniref:non-specific serine/threonine protein kinase n=1 Tax=Oncorhynchus mykiss TaxID=8022 RepID=A0A060YQ84_ONCMY|nr:unnamed protein product [Oncorhynchus mykiss]
MGNQLAGIAPAQILSVDSYFSDINDHEYDKSLGSTRFFKVARAKHREGLVVVKVFAIQDPSLPLTSYKQELEELKIRLHSCQNCLPFQKASLTEKAAILFRQYVRDNLYDRISTRPFLNNVEKRWLAFQILTAVDQAHKSGVRHGDIKTENVMVTSWNWVLLTDFASFKPTYLPEDNPADFNYFFDTSRRRTCYIAPERFVDGSMFTTESDQNTPLVDLTSNSQRSRGELKQAMDIFSAGCVIAELFTEGVPLFDLSQLLAYRKGHFQTEHVLMKIEDHYIRELVAQMVQREPEKRLTAEEYLKQQRGNAFPDIFYTFLQPYMAQFAKETFQSADERVLVIRKDLDNILHNLRGGGSGGSTEKPEKGDQESSVVSTKEEQGLVVLVSVITSCLQTLRSCDSKLAALELVLHLAGRLRVETLLDRITPYLLHFCSDLAPRVRAQAVRTLAKVLALVKEVPRNDVNIYPEYILPGIAHLAQDDATIVRLAYAENIAHLAETALRFLELVQENNLNMEHDLNGEDTEETLHPNENYDSELQALHEMVQQKVVTLLSDSENIVKQSLMENGITRLCVFFGRQKANDVLLSHMITFLNDKNDWHLRGAFFDSIVGKGQDCVTDTVPTLSHSNMLMVKAGCVHAGSLRDIEILKCIFSSMTRLSLSTLALPPPSPHFLLVSIDKEIVLLSVLKEPVSRSIFDYSLRSKDIASLFRHLLLRQKKRSGSLPECPIPEDPAIAQLLKKLLSQGMTEAEEDKLLALKDFMLKSNKAKANMGDQSHLGEAVQSGVIDLATLGIMGRQVDLVKPKQEAEDKRARKHTKQDSNMNEEWKSMFGSQESAATAPQLPTVPEGAGTQTRKTTASLGVPVGQSAGAVSTYQRRLNTCKAELQHLVQQKREQCSAERMAKQMMESAEWESRPPPPGWHPKGLLVAHLHEHKSAVNRIRVSDEHSIFATASNDGTVKVWDSQKMEGKTTTTRYANQILTNNQPVNQVVTNNQPVNQVVTNNQPVNQVATNNQPVNQVVTNNQPVNQVVTNNQPVNLVATNQLTK